MKVFCYFVEPASYTLDLAKNVYDKNIQFVAISDWLKTQAEKSNVLDNCNIKRIYNNIDLGDFTKISKEDARSLLKISTNKKIKNYTEN